MHDAISAPSALTDGVHPPPISLREICALRALRRSRCCVLLYFVGAEEGATSLVAGHYVHEFVHDGRHLLGFPCH